MSRKMKDSGVEWIGAIPNSWVSTKLKSIIKRLYSGGTPESGNEDYYCEFGEKSSTPWVSISDMSNNDYVWKTKKAITESGLKSKNLSIIPSGTLIYSIYATLGKVSELKINAVVNQAILGLSINNDRIDKSFLKFWFKFLEDYLDLFSTSNTQNNLNANKVLNLNLLSPPFSEQKNIAKTLSEKISNIDSIIEKTKLTIEDYKLLKQSIITEAVTKGLDKNLEMKDSGIEWIGEVPKQWNVRKISSVVDTIGSGTTPKTSDESLYFGNINWIQSGDINGGIITNVSKKINQNALNSSSALRIYNSDFVVVAMYGASIGNVSISKINACVNQACCVLQSKSFNVEFLYYLMKAAKNYLVFSAAGGTQPNISQEKIKQLRIPFPSIDEQNKIAENLNGKCYEIDRLLTQKVRLLEELESYKKSLIYEYVTGKKEVE